MNEFIDKLIERLEEERKGAENELSISKDERFAYQYAIHTSITIVNQLAEEYKVSEMPTGWISVSERLPEEDKRVLCQEKNNMFIGFVDSFDGEWRDNHHYRRTNVKAWCELPAPFTEGE
jgi:hypothetical protein